MKIQYIKEYSNYLKRDMDYKIYGEGKKLCLAIPSQNGKFYEWEDRGMIHSMSKWIEDERLCVITCDTIDGESWSFPYDTKTRIEKHELWIQYLIKELIPNVQKKTKNNEKWMVTGVSLGASHAANLIFRFPDVFDTLIALSGIYDMDMFYGDYHDENTYNNNPCAYLSNMPENHPYIQLYNQSQLIFCVGQGDWEQECVDSLRQFSSILYEKKIHAWCDFWGYDVYHDWPWWQKQIVYFLENIDF